MKLNLRNQLQSVWSSTGYNSTELTRFAQQKMVLEARKGLAAMSILTIVILVIESLLYLKFSLDPMYLYTCAILVVLSLNILFSAHTISDPQALHLLGVTLLVVSGTAFVLLAHYQQEFHPMMFASVAMLFIVIPMMAWGLREALAVTLLIYAMFTLSTLDAIYEFADQSLWTLQFIMLGAGAVSLSLVARNVNVRKHDLETQHDLIVANDLIADLSNRDPLTGAWNRRYFDVEYHNYLEVCRQNQKKIHFMLLDIDDFKTINDNCGHESGDLVLQDVASVFESLVAGNGNLVRMGGDEFAVIFADLDPTVIARRGMKKIREMTQDSKYVEVVNLKLSFGVASVSPEVKVSYRQLYKQADLALYRAKGKKGNGTASPNIVVSILRRPSDVFISTQRLWGETESDDGMATETTG